MTKCIEEATGRRAALLKVERPIRVNLALPEVLVVFRYEPVVDTGEFTIDS